MWNSPVFSIRLARLAVIVGALLLMPLQAPTAQDPAKGAGLARLKAGNERFAKHAFAPVSLSAPMREALAKGQHPFAMVLSSKARTFTIWSRPFGRAQTVRRSRGRMCERRSWPTWSKSSTT